MVLVKVPVLGRKWTLVLSSILMGMSLFLYSFVNTEANRVGLNSMEYFFQTLFNAVVSSRSGASPPPAFFFGVSHFFSCSCLDGHRKYFLQQWEGLLQAWLHSSVVCLAPSVLSSLHTSWRRMEVMLCFTCVGVVLLFVPFVCYSSRPNAWLLLDGEFQKATFLLYYLILI